MRKWLGCTPGWICAVTTSLVKPALALALTLPAAWAAWAIVQELSAPGSALGPDPGKALVLHFGEWALRIVLATLLLTTLQRRTPWKRAVRSRRMVGLFAFFYTTLHVVAYLGFLAEFSWREVLEDITDRTYITVGFAAWVVLFALALTSTRGWQRRMGRRWKTLHRFVYLAVAFALLHLWWLTKDGYGELALYTAVFLGLMAERYLARRGAAGA